MVQNLAEPLSEDVIKVTIKDKPGPRKPQLRAAFDLLKLYALQERRVRQLRALLEESSSRRRLRSCLAVWRELARAARRPPEPVAPRPSGEARIELLVGAIAERQRELRAEPERRKRMPEQQSATAALAARAEKLRVRAALREQRTRLAEQRRRQQQEAKLRELDRTAKQTSRKTIEMARRALEQCDQRTRRGIVHLMREHGCRDQPATEIPPIPSPPRFLMRMEARSEARRERMRQTDETRRRRREEQKRRDEAARLRAEEEQRQQQIKAQREAARTRREQELKRLQEIEKSRRVERLADQCYNRYLFRRYVVEPLSGIVREKRQVLEAARKHYEDSLLAKVFAAWKGEWAERLRAKLQLADELRRHNLLWYSFDEWRRSAVDARRRQQVAVDFYDANLQKKCFGRWHLFCLRIKVRSREQEARAKKHCEKHLKRACFGIWKRYVSLASEINESEQRRDEWRDLIKKFIPEAR